MLGQSCVNPPWLPEGIRKKTSIERYRVQELNFSADHGETGVPFSQPAQWGQWVQDQGQGTGQLDRSALPRLDVHLGLSGQNKFSSACEPQSPVADLSKVRKQHLTANLQGLL